MRVLAWLPRVRRGPHPGLYVDRRSGPPDPAPDHGSSAPPGRGSESGGRNHKAPGEGPDEPGDRRSPGGKAAKTKARQAVASGLLALALAHLGLNLALDTVKPEWRDPEFGWRMKRLAELDRTRGDRPLVVALGSSRTQMGFSPADMGVADGPDGPVIFNMGQAGAGPLLQLLNLRRLLAAGVHPDAVLVEVLPAALHNDAPGERQLATHVPRLGAADMDRLAPYCDDPAALRRGWAKVRLAPWYSLRFYLMSHLLPGFLPWQQRVDFQWRMVDGYGWSGYPFEPVPAAERARGLEAARKDYEENLATFRVSALPDRAVRDLLALCRREGIRAGFYLLPESPAFRAWSPPAARAALAAYLAGLSREFGVAVFDATDWEPEEAFADGHHLLKSGARAFSRRFGRECLGPWLGSPGG